jgi:penicillin-insensitive murein DD-endopeptidase
MTPRLILFFLLISAAVASGTGASAQDKGSVDPKPLPPLANPNDPKLGARELFARKVLPAAMPTRVIGSYVKGCIAGAEQMPVNGDAWQVMRLSRNRYWGHPDMVALLKRLAAKAHKDAGWPGILVGDIGQPRGGPALSGHASHQIGLDADIWLTPMPDHQLSREEREEMSATMMVREDRLDVDPKVFTPGHVLVLRDAAQEPAVQRIFVNAAIKKALCREATGDRSWLSKIRPWYGHDYHFHIRMACPPGASDCKGQSPQGGGEGCGKGELGYWFKNSIIHPAPPKEPEKPSKPGPGITMAALPPACKQVLNAPDQKQ